MHTISMMVPTDHGEVRTNRGGGAVPQKRVYPPKGMLIGHIMLEIWRRMKRDEHGHSKTIIADKAQLLVRMVADEDEMQYYLVDLFKIIKN